MFAPQRKAVFLDRDGVLNAAVTRNGISTPPMTMDEFILLPGVEEAVGRLKSSGFVLVVVTNQPDIARGTRDRATVAAINDRIHEELDVDSIYMCPHDDADECDCRKPKPGMLLHAMNRFDIDPARSFMIGDRWRDVVAGRAAGCRTIQVGTLDEGALGVEADVRRSDLFAAVEWILTQEVQSADR